MNDFTDRSALSTSHLFDFKDVGDFAADYLRTYYADAPTDDEQKAISFLVWMLKQVDLPKLESGLVEHFDVACGPTLHHVIPLAPYVDKIWMGDYLPENLAQVVKWWRGDGDAHDWRLYTELALAFEQNNATPDAVAAREALTRQKIGGLLHCDFLRPEVLDQPRCFSSVGCFYGTEEVGINKPGWAEIVARVTRLVAPGGYLFLAVLGETDSYAVHASDGSIRRLPAAYLTMDDVAEVIGAGPFDAARTHIEEVAIEGQQAEGVNKVHLVAARRSG